MTQDELALELANKALNSSFDPEAYIVKFIAEERLKENKSKDLVPDSSIDEGIQLLLDLFVAYFNNKSVDTLEPFLLMLRQVISELYNTCPTVEERDAVRNFIILSQSIV